MLNLQACVQLQYSQEISVLATCLAETGIWEQNLPRIRTEEACNGIRAKSIGLTPGGDKVTDAKTMKYVPALMKLISAACMKKVFIWRNHLNMHVKRKCFAQLQTGPRPQTMEIWGSCLLHGLIPQFRFSLICFNAETAVHVAHPRDNTTGKVKVGQLGHGSEISSTPCASLHSSFWTTWPQRATPSESEIILSTPHAARNGMVSNNALKTRDRGEKMF